MNVAAAAASGDHLKLLIAMRERVALAITDEECPPRDLAALTRRLQDIAKEIAELQERMRQEAGELNHATQASNGTWSPSQV
jgi:hypothetical protein